MWSAAFSPLFSPSQESSPQPSSVGSQSWREAEYERGGSERADAPLQRRAVSDTLLSPSYSLPSSPSALSVAASASPAVASVSAFSLSPSQSPSPSPQSAPASASASASVSASASESPSSASPPPPRPPSAPLSPRPLLSTQLQRLHAAHPQCLQLSLSHNALTSLCSFAPFCSLLTLDLSYNLLTAGGALPHLAPLLSLRILSLACNCLLDLQGLPPLPSLTSIDLSANRLQPPAFVLAPLVAAVPLLERLSVRGNPLCRSALCGRLQLLQTLSGLQRLRWLDDLPTQLEGIEAEADVGATGRVQSGQQELQLQPPRGPTGTQRKTDERERKYSMTTAALPFSLLPAASASAAVAPLPPGDGLRGHDEAGLQLADGCKRCRMLQRTVGQQESMLAAQLGVAAGGLTVWRQAMQALLLRLQDSEAEAESMRQETQQQQRAAAAESREKEQELQLMRRLWDEGRARLLSAEQEVTRCRQKAESSTQTASRREAELRRLSTGCAAVMASTELLRSASERLSSHSRRLQYAASRIAMLRRLTAAERPQQSTVASAAEDGREDDAAVAVLLSSAVDGRELQRLRADRRLLLQREQDAAMSAAERERALQLRVDSLLVAAAEDGKRLMQQQEEQRRTEREKEDWRQRWRLLVRQCTAGAPAGSSTQAGRQSARQAAAASSEAPLSAQSSGPAAAVQASRLLSLASLSRQLLQEAQEG